MLFFIANLVLSFARSFHSKFKLQYCIPLLFLSLFCRCTYQFNPIITLPSAHHCDRHHHIIILFLYLHSLLRNPSSHPTNRHIFSYTHPRQCISTTIVSFPAFLQQSYKNVITNHCSLTIVSCSDSPTICTHQHLCIPQPKRMPHVQRGSISR